MPGQKNPWFRIAASVWSLGLDAGAVIAMRTAKIAAGGPGAQQEASQMISEKVEAANKLGLMALSGALGWSAPTATSKTIAHYRRKVRANRRRFSK